MHPARLPALCILLAILLGSPFAPCAQGDPCTIDPGALYFGLVPLGEDAFLDFSLTNNGAEPLSGFMEPGGTGFHVDPADQDWTVGAGQTESFTVRFSPLDEGDRLGTLDLGNPLCNVIGLRGTGADPQTHYDVLGIYFDTAGATRTHQTTTSFQMVTAYLLIMNPSTAGGARGWECCVEMAGAGVGLSFYLYGDAVNVDAEPCFSVGLGAYPLFGEDVIRLARLQFFQPSAAETTVFYIHPSSIPSLPGLASYVDGLELGRLISLDWDTGQELLPVAGVNCDPLAGLRPAPAVRLELQGHPNPFNPATTLRYTLDRDGPVRLRIHDLAGRLVRTLIDGQEMTAGTGEVVWRGVDETGRSVPSGVYFCRLQAGGGARTLRLTLLK